MDYFDETEKTITMASGTDPLIIGMKRVLLENSWGILTYGSDFDIETIDFSTITTRYLMTSNYIQGSDLIYGDFVREYSFVIYDVVTEAEVMILYGTLRSVEQVLYEFETLIQSNES